MAGPFAHAGQLLPHDAWGAWSLHRAVVVPMVVTAAVYWRGKRPEQRRGQHAAFVLGWTAVAGAFLSPIDAMSGVLASAHMVQHLLLLVVAAPLLAYAAPGATIVRGLPVVVRRHLDVVRRGLGVTADRIQRARSPVGRLMVFTAVLWLWHASTLYTAALDHEVVHVLQHGSFLTVGYLVWAPVLGAARARVERLVAVGVIFVLGLQNIVLSLLLTFSTEPWYTPYSQTAPDWGLDALADQHLAGAIMWVPVGVIHLVIALGVLGIWLREPDPAFEPSTDAPSCGRVPRRPGPGDGIGDRDPGGRGRCPRRPVDS